MRFGVNMFGSNVEFTADKEGFLKKVSSLGYRYIEPCIMLNDIPPLKVHAWTLSDLAENAVLLNKYGLRINSAHIFTFDIGTDADKLVEIAGKYAIKQLICPVPVKEISKDTYSKAIPVLLAAAEKFSKAGIELLLHNGENESRIRIDGVSAYEWILRELKGKVFAQPDVGWLLAGGVDPEEFLWRNEDIVRSLHYKDFKVSGDTHKETAIGTGDVDMMACFTASVFSWIFISYSFVRCTLS